MSSNIISEKYQNDGKVNGLSAFSDKSLAPINGRYRSKSLSSDKLNKTNADRAAILEDVEDYHVSAKAETPGCLVGSRIMDVTTQTSIERYKDGKVSYGTDNTPVKGRRVIFCVHGNPSTGCCAVIETNADPGMDGRNGSISDAERHCHRQRNEEVDKRARRKLIIASVLCVIFMIGEVIGGYISNSLAIATDAAHLLTDFASFMISLFALWVANRPATQRMSFGWYRAEVIGALTSVLLIWVVTGVLVYMAIQRVIYKNFDIDATVMLITSAVGVAVNLIMGLTLHQHGHSHGGSHGHAHGSSNPVLNNKDSTEQDVESSTTSQTHSQHTENINVRAAFIHVVGDFLQSFGVFIAAIVIYFKPEWNLVDPICTFLFSVLVLITTFNIIKDALLVLMEGSPRNISFQEVANTFLSLEGVVRVHNLRLWALSLDKTALSAHLAISAGVAPQKVLEQATRLVHDKYNFFEMTLQIEEFSDTMEDCSQCNELGYLKHKYYGPENVFEMAGTSDGNNIDRKQKELSSNINELSSNANELSSNTNVLSGNTNQISSNRNKLSKNRNDLSSNRNELSGNTNELSSNINDLSSNRNELSSNTNELSSNVNELSSNVNELSSNVNELSSNKNDLSSNRNDLSSNRNELSSNRNELSSNTNVLSSNINDLSSNRNELSSNVNDLSSNRNELSSNQSKLSSKQNENAPP